MKKHAILHISDLHIGNAEDNHCILEEPLYFQALKRKWEKLNNEYNIDKIIIGGDIVNRGGSKPGYMNAKEKLENLYQIIFGADNKCCIEKITMVPGNHEIDRDKLKLYVRDENVPAKEVHKHKEKKLEAFIEFSNNFYGEEKVMRMNQQIIYDEIYHESILILYVDSTYKIALNNEPGYIEAAEFESEIEKIKEKYGSTKYNEYTKIIVFHHMPYGNQDDQKNIIGTFDKNNWNQIKQILLDNKVQIIMCGHVHQTSLSYVALNASIKEGLWFDAVGSLGTNFNNELENLLNRLCTTDPEIKAEKDRLILKLKKNEYLMSMRNYHNGFNILCFDEGSITRREFKCFMDVEEYKWLEVGKVDYIVEKNDICNEAHKISEDIEFDNPVQYSDISNHNQTNEKTLEDIYKQKIIDIIKKEGLFKLGHFHWGQDNRALGWIDTDVIINNQQYLDVIRAGIRCRYANIIDNAECIIGLGIKGTLLMNSIRYLFPNKNYSYYPEIDIDYSQVEKIMFSKIESTVKFKNIVVLTDVVHGKKTVKGLIRNMHEVHNRIEEEANVDVICILRTNLENSPTESNDRYTLKINSLCELQVPVCTKQEDCIIATNKLGRVYEFNVKKD